ncbi:MAG: hypothetical protein QOE70_2676 [Chthoniobacter sp.]|jgi:hypothetical protein|nr:hypothetical protein [Chthoniobacter sp.]
MMSHPSPSFSAVTVVDEEVTGSRVSPPPTDGIANAKSLP